MTRFFVTLALFEPPLYMVIDLLKDTRQHGKIEYLCLGDSRVASSGRGENVWFGVTNDSVDATDKLVMRRVPAGRYMMGDETNAVAVTHRFPGGYSAHWVRPRSDCDTVAAAVLTYSP